MRPIRGYHEVQTEDSDVLDQVLAQRSRLAARLARIDRVVAVASGKGGVGKSALTANVAALLASRGRAVGALDGDLNGPSLGRMLGATGQSLEVTDDGVRPVRGVADTRVVSMDLLLASDDAPVHWREPEEGAFVWQSTLETGALREFLSDVAWGPLDLLLIDVPPGTDKLDRLLQLVPDVGGIVLVTTPSEAARFVVAKSIRLVRERGVEVVGLAANMSGWVCPDCGREEALFHGRGGHRLAEEAGVPIWAEIPFDPRLAALTDAGSPFVLEHPDSPAGRGLTALAERIEREVTP